MDGNTGAAQRRTDQTRTHRPSNQRWCNGIGLFAPEISPSPAVGPHQIVQQFTNGQRLSPERFRPRDARCQVLSDSDEHHTRTELGNAIVGCVRQLSSRHIAQSHELLFDLVAEVVKDGIEQAAHVLKHYGLRTALIE